MVLFWSNLSLRASLLTNMLGALNEVSSGLQKPGAYVDPQRSCLQVHPLTGHATKFPR